MNTRHVSSREYPRRLLLTADTVGGVWTYVMELCTGLQSFEIEIALAVVGNPVSPAQRRSLSKLRNVECFEKSCRLEWMENAWADVEEVGEWLLEIDRHFRPDCVHLNGYAHAALPWKTPVLVAAHSCVLSWWKAVRKAPVPAAFEEYRRRVRLGLDAADHLVAPTKAILEKLEPLYGTSIPSSVIFNGASPGRFRPVAKSSAILSAGRLWDEAKNIALLDAIAPQLDWPVLVAGERRHPERGDEPVRFEQVQVLGVLSREAMADECNRAAIYAAPALYEPFGYSILEAAMAGCALVLADIPTLRELWDGAAVFVAPRDARGWADALNSLARHASAREQLAIAARKQAEHYTAEKMARRYGNLYGELIAHPKRGAKAEVLAA